MLTQQGCGQRASLFAAAVMMLAMGLAQAGTSYQGPPVRIGKGSAHTVVHVDNSGKAVAVGLVLSAAALQGLPKPAGEHTDFAYQLRMPAKGPKTVVDHVVVNWESTGHPPPRVYDVPHFDFHFYLVSRHEQMQVSFNSEAESGDPSQQPPAELLPAGYVVPPGTAVPQMGVHAINPAAGEFQGQPFSATFIYGYHQQQLTFLEPMASLAFLQSQPDFSAAVPRPASYSKPGSYPASYSVRYQRASKSYEILLSELQ